MREEIICAITGGWLNNNMLKMSGKTRYLLPSRKTSSYTDINTFCLGISGRKLHGNSPLIVHYLNTRGRCTQHSAVTFSSSGYFKYIDILLYILFSVSSLSCSFHALTCCIMGFPKWGFFQINPFYYYYYEF